jgi:Lon protease-like protein
MEYGTMLEIKSIQMLPDGRSMVETMGSYRFKLLESGSLDGYTVGRTERYVQRHQPNGALSDVLISSRIDDITPEDEEALERLSIQRARNARTAATASASGATPTSSTRDIGTPLESTSRRPSPLRSISTDALSHQQQVTIPLESFPTSEPSTAELMATCQSFIEQLRSGSAPWLLQRLNNTYGPMPDTPSEFSYWMASVMPIDEYEKARLLPIRSPRLRLRLIVHWVEQLRSSWW